MPYTFDANNPLTHWREFVDPLRVNIVPVHIHRDLSREVVAAIDRTATPSTTATWRDHYANLYVGGQMMAVRRIIRGKRGEYSLSGLLSAMEEHPEALTADDVVGMAEAYHWGQSAEDLRTEFARNWAGSSGHLDPAIPRRDRSSLFQERRRVIEWADVSIAHINRLQAPRVSFADLDEAIDHVTEVFQRYGRILTGNHYAMDQIVHDLNWWRTFERPLFYAPPW